MEPTNFGSHEPLRLGSMIEVENYEIAKCSLKSSGVIQAYAVNTNQGIVRYYL